MNYNLIIKFNENVLISRRRRHTSGARSSVSMTYVVKNKAVINES